MILIILVLYLYVVEYPPSAVRALLMIISWQFSQLISKKQNSVSSLMLSCYVVLLHDPRSIMDIGFQLSYSVVLSILIISLGFELNDLLWNVGLITLWIAAIITLLSGYNYMVKGLKHI